MHAETARGLGLGTGSRASAMSTSALAYNPAALVVGRVYHIEAAVDYMPEFHSVALGGAVVDSSTSKIGAGIGLRGFLSGAEGLGGIDGRLAIAFPFTDAISLGLGGRYISLNSFKETPVSLTMPNVTTTTKQELAQGFTMDVSMRIQAAQMLHLEIASFNFIDLGSEYVPVMIDASAAMSIGEIGSVGIDFLTDASSYDKATYTIGGGTEFLAGGLVPLRAGYAFDTERKLHWMSAGLGYTDKWVGFDISLRQEVSGGNETRILGGFRYYVH